MPPVRGGGMEMKMKLSMWILADRMEAYHPQLKISSGERVIRFLRLYSKNSPLSGETLYIRSEKNGDVTCTCGPDRMIFPNADLNEIFNTLLNTFDYYSQWEQELVELLSKGETLHELLLCSSNYLSNYLVFADPGFYMRDMAGDEQIPKANKLSIAAIKRRMLPMKVLLRLNKDRKIRQPLPKSYIYELPEIRSNPVMSNLFVKDLHRGWLISWNSDSSYTQGTLDLQDILAEYVCRWIGKREAEDKVASDSQLLLDLLEGTVNEERLEEQLAVFGWKKSDSKVLFFIRQQEITDMPIYAVERYLASMEYPAFLLEKGSALLYLLNTSKVSLSTAEQRLARFFSTHHCIAGESPEFSDLLQLPTHYQAALIAQEYADSSFSPKSPVIRFDQITLPYALNLVQKKAVLTVLHPALNVLKEYDEKHDTDLYETLYVFLEHKQNATDTAETLFIHRSTLLYRLERIRELTGIELTDFQTQVHLEISYLMEKLPSEA